MSERHVSAHPILEPLDYEFTPESARAQLNGDLLTVYALLWTAALASAVDGPVIRPESIELQLRASATDSSSDPALLVGAFQDQCLDRGWGELLPSELHRSVLCTADVVAAFPEVVTNALKESGQGQLDGAGRRIRSAQQCTSFVSLLDLSTSWRAEIATLSDPAPSLDRLIELMVENGIGRPSSFADRLTAAIDNNLVLHANNQVTVGDDGQQVLDALSKLPHDAVIDAKFNADLERALLSIETDHYLAGEILSQFCERALGAETALADWLDAQVIVGESLNESLARAEATLPPANSWDAFPLPAGMSPERLARNPEHAINLRAELDEILAKPDRRHWKQASSRQRAVWRLAALGDAHTHIKLSFEDLAATGSRDIVLRWWIDLAPQEAPLSNDELHETRARMLTLDRQTRADIALVADSLQQSL